MPYIGKSPVSGGFHKLGNLTASATATYALTLNGAAYFPETANQLLVSLNGVIQAPQDSFTVSGSNLVFDSALTASDSIDFVVALGDVLGVGSVTDGAITTAKISNNAVTEAKIGNDAVTKAKIGTTELDLATIKDSTGTNNAFTIASSGIVTNAKPVGFSVSIRGGSNQSISNTTYTKLEFTYESSNANHFDTHSGWSNSDHYYTVPAGCGGYWMLSSWVELASTGTSNILAISKTASIGSSGNFIGRITEGENAATTANGGLYFNVLANLSDGDIIKSEVYHNYGSNVNALEVGNYLRTAMQGWRLF
jgi:hypothetical protein